MALVLFLLRPGADVDPFAGTTHYRLRTGEILVVVLGAVVVWYALRRGREWDADLIPALWGAVSTYTLVTALNGTAYSFAGLFNSDQSFRTEQVTRFADTGWSADYFYRGLHAYYAPLVPWLEGRLSALLDVPPWHMIKFGTIVAAFVAPVFAYLMWRRLVSARTAAFLAGITLVTGTVFYEPYAWIVLVLIVPWWLEAVHGLSQPGLRPRHPVVLGLIGALMFCTYYYYFFVCVIVFALWLVVERRAGSLSWERIRRSAGVLAIAAGGSAVFWGPLLYDIVTADEYHPKNNRWFEDGFGDLALPMFQPTIVGALCLLGAVYLLWTIREPLSRLLVIFVAATYIWHVIGFLTVIADMPLMSFKMRELVQLILLYGAVLGLVRLAQVAATRLAPTRQHVTKVARVAFVATAGLCLFAVDGFVTTVIQYPLTAMAHSTPYPDGSLPRYSARANPDAKPLSPSAVELSQAIDARYRGPGHPVLLSDRQDVFAFYPYYGFVQWMFTYSHPTAEFDHRVAFLAELAAAPSPDAFADLVAHNRFDGIDAIVLRRRGDCLSFNYGDDNFPEAFAQREVCLPMRLLSANYFDIAAVGDFVVAVRRLA
jgi:galactan 5-O-arabinofuranosyltransferase